jgi:hypothetical protein
MADPVVHITAGLPDSGTGNITTLGQTLLDGANLTMGVTTGAAVTTDATGTLQQYLRGLIKLFTTATFKAASTAPVAADPALVVAISPNSVNANGSALSVNSAPVVIASDQGAVAAKLQATTAGGLTRSRTLIPNNVTAIVVKSGAGQLYKVRCTNNSAVVAYLKIYDATSATAGSGTPVDTIMIPASTSGAGIVDSTDVGTPFTTGLTFIVTTGIADADTAVPAANAYIVTMYYK